MTDHAALIADLERGPASRELSDRVLLALGWTRSAYNIWLPPSGGWRHERPDITRDMQAVLDALPADFEWRCGRDSSADPQCFFLAQHETSLTGSPHYRAKAPTPALAGCIALVKIAGLEKQ